MTSRARWHHPAFRLGVLTCTHFLVDFYAGLLVPLPEPTLTGHFSMRIAHIALLVGGFALFTNIVQPLSAWLLPRRGLPILLLLTPPAAALTSLIGLSNRPVVFIVLLLVAGLGVGLLHPEGTLSAHDVAGRRPGLGIGLFMSAGYLGFAAGSVAAGTWVESFDPPLARFWVFALPALLVVVLVRISGLDRLKAHDHAAAEPERGDRPFAPVFLMAVGIATSMSILIRLFTILLVRRFPEASPQGWGGTAVFATGVTGAVGAFLWGGLSDRFGPERILAWLHLAALPFLWRMIHVSHPSWAPLWGLGVGITLGSAFPLVVVLARHTRCYSPRFRMGLIIGGAWGLGETAFILSGFYLDRFPPHDPAPVLRILYIPFALLLLSGGLALHMTRAKRTET